MNLPANISAANLPATYEAAKVALATCERMDECKDWADRAAALASYAKQAEDDELEMHARRIRARAIRRAGELLSLIEPKPGARTDLGVTHPQGSRASAAADAGMSPDQAKQALRVARVPEAEFERQVEAPRPATVTALAQQGTAAAPRPAVDLGGRDGKTYNRILHFLGDLENAAAELGRLAPGEFAARMTNQERARANAFLSRISAACASIARTIEHEA